MPVTGNNLRDTLDSLLVCLKLLDRSVKELPSLLDEEEKAVTLHDISMLEKALIRKKACGEAILEAKKRCQELGHRLGEQTEGADKPESLTDLLHLLEGHKPGLRGPLASSVLRTCHELLVKITGEFASSHIRIKRNQFIVSKLLQNHQESYRFWNQLIREKNSRYNEKGTVKDLQNVSQISIKA